MGQRIGEILISPLMHPGINRCGGYAGWLWILMWAVLDVGGVPVGQLSSVYMCMPVHFPNIINRRS